MTNQNDTKQNTPTKANPVKKVVDVMRKIDTKSPDAAKNEKSIVDKNGKRINLNDEDVRFNYFKGTFERKSHTDNKNGSKK
jgi:hypothetical protein